MLKRTVRDKAKLQLDLENTVRVTTGRCLRGFRANACIRHRRLSEGSRRGGVLIEGEVSPDHWASIEANGIAIKKTHIVKKRHLNER